MTINSAKALFEMKQMCEQFRKEFSKIIIEYKFDLERDERIRNTINSAFAKYKEIQSLIDKTFQDS